MKKEGFSITWQAEDGYAGGARPHSVFITANELNGDETEDDLKELYNSTIQVDFEQTVYPSSNDEEAFLEWAKVELKKMEAA